MENNSSLRKLSTNELLELYEQVKLVSEISPEFVKLLDEELERRNASLEYQQI